MPEIHGSITLADMSLKFACDNGQCEYTVTFEVAPGHTSSTTRVVPQAAFLKALSIAVHNDGTPDYQADYPDAESVQPSDSNHRWIP